MTGTPWTAARWTQVAGWVSLLAAGGAAAADLPPHPRLLLPAAGIAPLEARVRRDPLAARIPDGKRLLGESRRALGTILRTALAWRLTGEAAFRDRCIAELDAACGLPDWNPPHFLDVAEMATADAVRKRGGDRFFPLHLLWLPEEPKAATLPLAAVFGGQQPVAMFRSAWDDPEALFMARLDGKRALLATIGKALELELGGSAAAAWRVEPASPGSPRERPNQGFHLLVAACPRAAHVTIEVTIRPRPPVAP